MRVLLRRAYRTICWLLKPANLVKAAVWLVRAFDAYIERGLVSRRHRSAEVEARAQWRGLLILACWASVVVVVEWAARAHSYINIFSQNR